MCALGIGEAHVVCFAKQHERIAKDYWQHSGEGISSRQAEACLTSQTGAPPRDEIAAPNHAAPILRARIARLTGVREACVHLFPCGMAAVYAAYRALSAILPGRKSVQFGFPYVDSLKIQQKFGPGVHLFPRGDAAELDTLETLLQHEAVSGVFTEFPSNPLLLSPDLERLSVLARRHGCPLVVDETVASFVNADLAPVADVVCTSLTKFFSGVGDVMGGALILNERSPFCSELSQLLRGQGEELLWSADLAVLERNSRDFEARVRGINAGAERLADFLHKHPKVGRVYYPKYETPAAYRAFQRPGGGYGGLFSFTLHDEAACAPRCFDALRVCKGPNLGMTYTLACLYTILAHYQELDFAESCGMSRYLIRVSVGLEEPEELTERFANALDVV
jgi:cystathionine gamma-synthase